jgi:hypothetical protein
MVRREVTLWLDEEFVRALDKRRGAVSRSRVIEARFFWNVGVGEKIGPGQVTEQRIPQVGLPSEGSCSG